MNADPDANEIANNSIGHNLNCAGNSPSPQIGDSGGGPNTVFGRANGQCNNPPPSQDSAAAEACKSSYPADPRTTTNSGIRSRGNCLAPLQR